MQKIPGGYILVARQIEDSDLSDMPPYIREIWLWILRNVTYSKDSPNYGKVLCTFNEIIEDLAWKVGFRKEKYKKWHCERAMSVLMNAGMIATTRATRGMWIEALNYAEFQDPENYERNDERATSATRAQHERLHDIRKKEEGIRKEEEIHIRTALTDGGEDSHSEILKLSEKDSPTPQVPAAPSSQKFTKPTVEQVRAYCQERGNGINAEAFVDHYQANGWKIAGKTPMKDWQAAVRNWERRDNGESGKRYAIKINGIEKEVTKAEYDAHRARNNPNL